MRKWNEPSGRDSEDAPENYEKAKANFQRVLDGIDAENVIQAALLDHSAFDGALRLHICAFVDNWKEEHGNIPCSQEQFGEMLVYNGLLNIMCGTGITPFEG